MATGKEKPQDVHVDLLEIDMKTGAHWLSPAQKLKHSAKFQEIRDKHHNKAKAKRKSFRVRAGDEKTFDPGKI
jgi:hypothetical protein